SRCRSAITAAGPASTDNQMKLFKLIASKAGKVVFDDRIEAENPRKAREQMKSLLGLQSLTGVVYSITEIPVELIREIVATKVLEIVGSRRPEGRREGSGSS